MLPDPRCLSPPGLLGRTAGGLASAFELDRIVVHRSARPLRNHGRRATPRVTATSTRDTTMKRSITALLGVVAAAWAIGARADVTVMAVRLGANDVVALAKFYETAFGFKEIDRVGDPATEIIMRYGATAPTPRPGPHPSSSCRSARPARLRPRCTMRSSACPYRGFGGRCEGRGREARERRGDGPDRRRTHQDRDARGPRRQRARAHGAAEGAHTPTALAAAAGPNHKTGLAGPPAEPRNRLRAL